MNKMIEIPVELFNGLFEYLGTRPAKEVEQARIMMMQIAKKAEEAEKATIKEASE